jgi:hypothetical protein
MIHTMDGQEQELRWSSPEFQYLERSSSWYLASLGVALILAVFALFQKNFLFLLFVVIGEATVLFMVKQRPRMYEFEITPEGVMVNGTMVYLFSALKGFAIVDDGISGYTELVLLPTKRLAQYIKILMPRQLSQAAHVVLSDNLSVVPYEERLSEVLMKRIGL